jgi:RHS repeat-associated protein
VGRQVARARILARCRVRSLFNHARYDAENRQTAATNTGVGTTNYTYDGDGRRVMKQAGGSTTTYVYDAKGQLAAEYGFEATQPPCATCYLTAGTLGSTRMVTDASGAVKALHDFLPFGEEITAGRSGSNYPGSDGITQKFTGKERDVETGLDWFGTRYLSSAQGRFTSPDNPKFSERADPQSWNLYGYVGNNPLPRIDPLGHNWFFDGGTWQWHQGADVDDKGNPCARGSEGCHHSDYTHLIVFQATSQRHGTAFGTVTLYGNNGGFVSGNILAKDDIAFSGGADGKPPIQSGNFEINLRKHGGVGTNRALSHMDASLAAYHDGIQDIGTHVDMGYSSWVNMQEQWGPMRAHLIPLQGQDDETYLHGKQLYFEMGLDVTHGCIATPDHNVLGKIFELDPNGVGEGAKNGRIAVSAQGTR